MPRKRRDECGRAFAGSQLQLQLYVNRRRSEIDQAICKSLNMTDDVFMDWRSPIEPTFAEYMDGAFLRALDLHYLRRELSEFWPRSGPRWDGLAVLRAKDNRDVWGYLLVEGKSYPGEVYGRGCGSPPATDNRRLIDNALAITGSELSPQNSNAWTGRLYQFANRLAHVGFLRRATGRPVWLVNVCFTDDPINPYSRAEWTLALAEIKTELGFDRPVPWSVDVFLPARDRTELVALPAPVV